MSQTKTQLITEIAEAHGQTYQVWADIIPCVIPSDHVCLIFSSVWTGAKDSTARQVKGEYFLDTQAVQRLINLLQESPRQ